MKIDASTKLCVLIGDPVEHSLSPAIHNAAFKRTGLNCVYLACGVKDVKSAVGGLRGLGIIGASVTIPHKVAAMRYVDEVEDVAKWIGSINTIVNSRGILKGYNTDAMGALAALKKSGARLAGANVLILGSGGAARAISFAVAADGKAKQIEILGIIEKEYRKLSRDISTKTKVPARGIAWNDKSLAKAFEKANIVVQCTPVGMYPKTGKTSVPQNLLRPGLVVMDIVYNPLETRFLKDARSMGCKVIPGMEMFLNQAVAQFELFTRKKAPRELMRRVIRDKLKS